MDNRTGQLDDRFSPLAMALNALERSRANKRILGSYKCPCTQCKGGGRPILRLNIETHLRRLGRDLALTHPMLPEDSDIQDFNFHPVEEDMHAAHEDFNVLPEENVDEGFDFERMAREWFREVDDKRESFFSGSDIDEEGNDNEIDISKENADASMQEWLQQSQVPLYTGSKVSTLASVLVLMNLVHLHNVSNSFMDELFSFMRLDILPPSNALPPNRHEARRYIDRLGLNFSNIHACQNGCVLFWKDSAGLSECPTCHSSRYIVGSNSIPVKVLRHFPVIPKLLRMYRCRDIATLMKWHGKNASTDGKVRSALDSPTWKEVQNIDSAFFKESRNVKLGLALDGMNPFADKSTRHSTWLVFLLNYNLLGWMVTKRFFVMLSLIIPGKESVKSVNIDVYLEPLVDELFLLWKGVSAVDMSNGERASPFTLRGILLWTIHDYPTYGLISGCATKGYQGCPICGPHVDSRFSKSLRKNIFQGHRRYLPVNHPFRFMTEAFNGKEEHCSKPTRVSGLEHRTRGEARDRWIEAGEKPSSENDPMKRYGVKRNSILFTLPYWDKLLIRHVLDVMHCEKNISENLLSTLLGLKDGLVVQDDMKETGCKRALHIKKARPPETGFRVPIAPYVLSTKNKRRLIDRLRKMKTPTGYMSNLKSKIDLDGKMHGLKSHDYHVLLQHVLPVCLRGLLPDRIMKAILLLSKVFRKICAKVIDPKETESLNEEVATALCLLEQEFPPSFFDPMSHLVVHLVEELHLCGPVHNRWMYPLERYMKYMKSYVRNKARPEGCMASGTSMEVGLGLSTEYILECESTRKRVWDAEEELRDTGEVACASYSIQNLSTEECQWAHACVLQNSMCLDELRETHKRLSLEVTNTRASFRRRVHSRQRRRMKYPDDMNLVPDFAEWLQNEVQHGNAPFEDDIVDLSIPPRVRTRSFKSMKAYVHHFRVFRAEGNLVTSDCGVTVTCETIQRSGASDIHCIFGQVTYFGKITEILELDYGRLKPILLLCDWVAPISRGPMASQRVDKYGFTLLKLNRLMRRLGNSFVFPLQASQIFFSECPKEPEWSAVVHTDTRSTRVFQGSDLDSTSTLLDTDSSFVMEDDDESEESQADDVNGWSPALGQHITEEALVASHVVVQQEAIQLQEGSEDDSLLDFIDDEDDTTFN